MDIFILLKAHCQAIKKAYIGKKERKAINGETKDPPLPL
jgi:hypothetical protein